ncbi:OLC1v1020446C1 [Oldenlandia corymbosa var. corymbosa]|uniref:OLC1v1020446C1 n=1 Tax=Oldenlandia corymbosa var. corymbosa TaxID=529605 RepID=A0AAV1EGZ9_OLDCO|nr:OLC1v1020446C1 [Oldenlandia corymbosa var. corymbosa]
MAPPTSGMITNENNNDDVVEVDNNANPGENAPLPAPFSEVDGTLMPLANLQRIMQKVLPADAKIPLESKELIQQCVNAFIGMITREANDWCKREHRKTIQSEDLLYAMKKLGFHDYVEPLMDYLQRYREFNNHGGSLPSFSSSSSSAAAVENPAASGFAPSWTMGPIGSGPFGEMQQIPGFQQVGPSYPPPAPGLFGGTGAPSFPEGVTEFPFFNYNQYNGGAGQYPTGEPGQGSSGDNVEPDFGGFSG